MAFLISIYVVLYFILFYSSSFNVLNNILLVRFFFYLNNGIKASWYLSLFLHFTSSNLIKLMICEQIRLPENYRFTQRLDKIDLRFSASGKWGSFLRNDTCTQAD